MPSEDIAISVLTNAVDGLSHVWLDGALQILKRFKTEGVPTRATKDWTGRWWSVWTAADLVPMGDKVLLASPDWPNPFLNVPELTIASRDEGRVSQASGFHSFGEPARRVRGRDGTVKEVRVGGTRLVPEDVLAKEVAARYET